MKRLLFLLIVLLLLSVTLTGCPPPQPPQPVDQNQASKYCKANDDFGLTHGKCVSYFTSASSVAQYCQEHWTVQIEYQGVQYNFENQGDCVSTINSWDTGGNPAP